MSNKEKVFHNVDEIPLISIFGKLIYISLRQVPHRHTDGERERERVRDQRHIKMFIKWIMVVDFIMGVLNFYLRKGFIMSNNRRNPLDL